MEKVPLEIGKPFILSGDGRAGSQRLAYLVTAPTGQVREQIDDSYQRVPSLLVAADRDELPEGFSRSRMMDFYGLVEFYDSRDRVTERYSVELHPEGMLTLTLLDADRGSLGRKIAWAVIVVCFLAACWWLLYWILNSVSKVISGTPPNAISDKPVPLHGPIS